MPPANKFSAFIWRPLPAGLPHWPTARPRSSGKYRLPLPFLPPPPQASSGFLSNIKLSGNLLLRAPSSGARISVFSVVCQAPLDEAWLFFFFSFFFFLFLFFFFHSLFPGLCLLLCLVRGRPKPISFSTEVLVAGRGGLRASTFRASFCGWPWLDQWGPRPFSWSNSGVVFVVSVDGFGPSVFRFQCQQDSAFRKAVPGRLAPSSSPLSFSAACGLPSLSLSCRLPCFLGAPYDLNTPSPCRVCPRKQARASHLSIFLSRQIWGGAIHPRVLGEELPISNRAAEKTKLDLLHASPNDPLVGWEYQNLSRYAVDTPHPRSQT